MSGGSDPDGVTGPGHVALVGPTASGKSALALAVAARCDDLEIVTVDSMQVYRGMDIGTAKPTADERARVPHHLLDLVEPTAHFTVADYQAAARAVLAGLEARGRRALFVGGTGLYLRSVTDDLVLPGRFPAVRAELDADPDTGALHARLTDLDPVAAARILPTNRRRTVRALEVTLGSGRPFSSFGPGLDAYPPSPIRVLALDLDRDVLDDRIARRYEAQLADGFLDEVAGLLHGPGLGPTAAEALGYRELARVVRGEVGLDDAVAEAVTRTRRFARRQQRWFRRDPRITWCRPPDDDRDNPMAVLPRLLEDCAAPGRPTGSRPPGPERPPT